MLFVAPHLVVPAVLLAAADSPPKRLNCTVILVAMLGSQNAASSCAAKMRRGLCLHQKVSQVSSSSAQP